MFRFSWLFLMRRFRVRVSLRRSMLLDLWAAFSFQFSVVECRSIQFSFWFLVTSFEFHFSCFQLSLVAR